MAPGAPVVQDALAQILLDRGEIKQAVSLLEKAVEKVTEKAAEKKEAKKEAEKEGKVKKKAEWNFKLAVKHLLERRLISPEEAKPILADLTKTPSQV